MLMAIKQRAAYHFRLLTYSSQRFYSVESTVKKIGGVLYKWDASDMADLPNKIRLLANASDQDLLEISEQKKMASMRKDQEFRKSRYDALGPDLAAATFIVHRGGKVKFEHIPRWTKFESGKKDALPNKKDNTYKLEGIDCSGMELLSLGLDNLKDLEHFRYLKLSSMKLLLDDWFLARLESFSDTLEFLDISKNCMVTEEGLISLYRLRKLKCLDITGCIGIHNAEIVSTYLTEINPDLTIIGVDSLPVAEGSLQEREQKERRFLNLGEPYMLDTKTDAKNNAIQNTEVESLSEKDKETGKKTFNKNKKAAQTVTMS